ncbi:MAG: permease [Natronincolaceae bacterium]|jgi:uncharacterized membrane protein YraQ (UPF0718 family)
MIKKIKSNLFLVGVIVIYLLLFIINTEKAMLSVNNSGYYLKEMLVIMPVVFLLTALIEAWVPKDMIVNALGEGSGLKGSFISLALGSVSAGPIYAAFPVCKTLLQKGASISNIVVILSSWAVIKIPMLANEAKFLSPKFMITRWIFTTIAIIFMGYIVGKLVNKNDMPLKEGNSSENNIMVNKQACTGCGICVDAAPDYFKLENRKAMPLIDTVKNEDIEKIDLAVRECPVNAIKNKFHGNSIE